MSDFGNKVEINCYFFFYLCIFMQIRIDMFGWKRSLKIGLKML